ncbi:hypothetical protein EVAR_28176_1 [Eumeta japonica]|uniref:Uncharacterized protein n=1 Tax=Eumeta variegata TaxID=151549 RepID=A0A4C1VIN6_EUMVA|nr:hypothetical protein EVAR_28176_1 [Eumeta japonica]
MRLSLESQVKEKGGTEIRIRNRTGFETKIETKSRTRNGIGLRENQYEHLSTPDLREGKPGHPPRAAVSEGAKDII